MTKFRYKRGERPLDGYTIQHGLGVGGFGEVYFAVSDAGREVALKSVQNFAEVELRGIQQCMNLKSQHLVCIYDVRYNANNEPFVIMEYVSGPSLRSLLDSAPDGLGATKSAFLIREMAKGLAYLHEAGIVHRDLKPHNVFYEDGIVKIGDYSLCKVISNSHRTDHTMTVGTVHYMAPEISEGRYDASVDIYAMGILLHEMLTGTPPFTGSSVGEVLMKHMTAKPDLSRVEEPFRSVIAKAIAKNPDERFATATEFVEQLFGAKHIHESMVDFNPQELTLVANQVAKKMLTTPSGHGESTPDSGANFTAPWNGDSSQVAASAPAARETRQSFRDDTSSQPIPYASRVMPPHAELQPSRKKLTSPGRSMFVAAVIMSILRMTVPGIPGFVGLGLALGALGMGIASGTRKGFWPVMRLAISCIIVVSMNFNHGMLDRDNAVSLAVAVLLFAWPTAGERRDS